MSVKTLAKPAFDSRPLVLFRSPSVEVEARFVMPCRFDDEVVVESEVGEWGRSSFTVRHRVLREGQLALDGFEKRVSAAPHPERAGAIKARAVPAEFIASLSDPTGGTTIALDDASKGKGEK